MSELFLPVWYHVYERSSGTWTPISNLVGKEDLFCWNGKDYDQVQASIGSYVIDRLALLDSVTVVGLGSSISEVHNSTSCFLPQTGDKQSSSPCGSTPQDCSFLALKDFGTNRRFCESEEECLFQVPRHRFPGLSTLVPEARHLPGSGPWKMVSLPKRSMPGSICERGTNPECRRHGIRYLETVLALKGRVQKKRKDHGRHVELRDDGMHVSPHAFRRLRRIVASCGVPNRYSFRVLSGKNGRGRRPRRRVRLGISDVAHLDCEVKEISEGCGLMENNNYREARILQHCANQTTGTDWVKVTLGSNSRSIVVEGMLILLV